MAGLFGIGGSASKTDRRTELGSWGDLSSLTNLSTSIGQQQTQAGNQALNQSQNYFSSLLSGQPGVAAQAVAPSVSALTTQAGQQRQQTAQFGNRSGGTNAAEQATTSKVSGEIAQLLNSLIPQAAGELGKIGAQREGLGITSLGQAGVTAGTLGGLTEDARKFDVAQAEKEGASIASLLGGL